MTDAVEFSSRGGIVYARVPETHTDPLSALVASVRRELPGMWIDWVAVREAYVYGRGRPFPIGRRRREASLDEKAKIRFSAAGVEAYLILYPAKPRGQRITEAELLDLAQAYGIPPHLVRENALRTALGRRSYRQPTTIAQGTAPIDGSPSWIRWRKGIPSDAEGFLVTFEERGEYPDAVLGEVVEGEGLGERVPPGSGVPGCSVRGESLPARPGDDPVDLGEGLLIAPDGSAIVAARGGHLRLTGSRGASAEILSLLVVNDAAGLQPWSETVFPGSLVVEGDLEVPFPVTILGDVEVRGSVVRSALEVMGSLFVRGGVIQHRGTPTQVGGIISAGFFERAWVTAQTVHVRTHSLKSRLLALDFVLSPKDGSLHGGQVAAGRRVAVGSLGTYNAMPTEVAIGLPSFPETFQNLYRGWANALASASADEESQRRALEAAARRWQNAAPPPPDLLSARVEADRLHPGVTVRIGSASRRIETLVGPVELAYEQIGPRGRVSMVRL